MTKEEKRLRRIKNSRNNAVVAVAATTFSGVLSFLERIVFNQCFIADYLGLYTLFRSIISMLSIVELGIGSAIGYSLYEPIDKGDEEQICALMNFYKLAYRIVGLTIFAGSLVVLPFLGFLVNVPFSMTAVRGYFMIFVARTTIPYFIGHREILITANQEKYKTTLVTNICWSLMYMVQMLISWRTGNFLYYIIAMVCFTTTRVIVNNIIAICEFPFLKKHKKAKVAPERMKRVVRNVKGIVISKFGGRLSAAADAAVISSMVSTAILGCYSNYTLLVKGAHGINKLFPEAITASLGNAGISETKRDLARTFQTLNVACFLVYAPITIFLVNVSTPVVATFFGADRILPFRSVVLVCIAWYLTYQRDIIGTFSSSLGLYWEMRKLPLAEGALNLVISLILGRIMGFDGIMLGTVISSISIGIVFQPMVIIHHGLRSNAIWYYLSSAGHFILTALLCALSLFINSFVPFTGLAEIIIKGLVAAVVPVAVLFLFYRKSEEAKIIIRVLKKAFSKKTRKALKSA